MAVRRPSTPYPIAVHIGGSLAAASCEPSNQDPMKSHLVTTQSYFIATLPATLTSWQVACWPACPEAPFRTFLFAVLGVT